MGNTPETSLAQAKVVTDYVNETMRVSFAGCHFADANAVDVCFDALDNRAADGARRWYFLVDYADSTLAPEAVDQLIARGRQTDLNHALGTVRIGADAQLRARIRQHATNSGYRAQLHANCNQATFAISEMTRRHRDGGSKPAESFLRIHDIDLKFGGVHALHDVGFSVERGEIFSIIGPNGAGKTSMLNVISGFYRPNKGYISFEGNDRTNLKTHQVAKLGFARTFQNIALFKGMTTLDNIMTGRLLKMKSNLLTDALYIGSTRREEVLHRGFAEHIIDFLEIQAIRKTPVGKLAYGLQKRVEFGRALAMEPKVLLLDEPMAGMNLEEKEDMARFILDVNDEFGTTIVLIEHDMGVVMDISNQIAVLDHGEKISQGTPYEVRTDHAVIGAYLGQSD